VIEVKEEFKIAWEGDSLTVLKEFPNDIRRDFGFQLRKLQLGGKADDVKPMTSIGSGVFELRNADERAWYRVIYISKIEATIYVLHSFEKKSAQTSKQDLITASLRFKQVKARIAEEKKNEKNKKIRR
jgi:phage-related protein